MKLRLNHRKLDVFKSCLNTRREFRSWKHKTDNQWRPLASDAFESGNNHLLDCLEGFAKAA